MLVALVVAAAVVGAAIGSELSATRLEPDGSFPLDGGETVKFSFVPLVDQSITGATAAWAVLGRRSEERTLAQFTIKIWQAPGQMVVTRTIHSRRPETLITLAAGRYEWSVQWRCSLGHHSRIAHSRVVVGVNHSAWQGAPWLGSPKHNEFRSHVAVSAVQQDPNERFELLVAALGFGTVLINGNPVSKDVLAYSGWTNTEKRVLYRSYDVTHLMERGKNNTIWVGLGSGYRDDPWWRFPAYRDWNNKIAHHSHDSIPKVFRLQLLAGSGRNLRRILTSNATEHHWASRQGPVTRDSVYDGETYDTRLLRNEWASVHAVKPNLGPRGVMVPAGFAGVQVSRVDRPAEIRKVGDDLYIVDFGSNVAGVCKVRVPNPGKIPKGEIIRIELKHGEVLQHGQNGVNNGRVYFGNLRSAQAKDVLIIDPGASQGQIEWRPSFTYHGFRYVEVRGFPGELEAQHIERLVMHTAVQSKSQIMFSNPVLQEIHRGSVGSQRSNLVQIPTDCPQRDERLGWLGDAGLSAESMMLHFDGFKQMAAGFVNSIVDEMDVEGTLPDVVPFQRFGERPADLSWSSAFVELLWQLWSENEPIDQHWKAVQTHVNYLEGLLKKVDGKLAQLPQRYGDWCPPPPEESGPKPGESPPRGFTSAFSFVRVFQQVADLASSRSDKERYAARAQQLAAQFHAEFFDLEHRRYGNGVMITWVLPLALKAVPGNLQAHVIQRLVEYIRSKNNTWTGGIINNRYLFDVLANHGHVELAVEMLKSKTYPSYGYMFFNALEPARESMWELPNAPFQGVGMDSRNHHMFSSVGAFLIKHVAGLQLVRPDDTRAFAVLPQRCEPLERADVTMRSSVGTLRFVWACGAAFGQIDFVRLEIPLSLSLTLIHLPPTLAIPSGFSQTQPGRLSLNGPMVVEFSRPSVELHQRLES